MFNFKIEIIMSKKPILIILILSIFLINSCSDKFEPEGKWKDNIKLSTKNVEFAAKTDSVTITTKG